MLSTASAGTHSAAKPASQEDPKAHATGGRSRASSTTGAWPLFHPPGFDRLGRRASPTEIRDAVRGNAAAADACERRASHLAANGVTLNADPLTAGVAPAFDPVREHFVDSPGADALLAREYRRGFEVREIT